MSTRLTGTRRMGSIEGDGQAVWRTARRFPLRATLYDASGSNIELGIMPDGSVALLARDADAGRSYVLMESESIAELLRLAPAVEASRARNTAETPH